MAKRKSTIGTNPLDAVIPIGDSATRSAMESDTLLERSTVLVGKAKKLRFTVHLPEDLIDRLKNAVYWSPGVTLASLSEEALTEMIERLEKERGGPFPHRREELKGGRPIK